MLAFKYLLMPVGRGSVDSGVFASSAYDLWLMFQYKRAKPAASRAVASAAAVRWRTDRCADSTGMGVPCSSPSALSSCPAAWPASASARCAAPSRARCIPACTSSCRWWSRCRCLICATSSSHRAGGRRQEARTPASTAGILNVQSKEGLNIGLAITVRYRLDPRRLDYVQSHLPQPVETEIVPPVVASAWRELAPSYTVREIFSSSAKRCGNAPRRSSRRNSAPMASWWKR